MNPVNILNNASLKSILLNRPFYARVSPCKWSLPFKLKSKIRPPAYHDGTKDEQRYGCSLSLTSAVDGVGGKSHVSTALPTGMTRYPICRRLGRPQDQSRRVRKIPLYRDSIPLK